MRRDGYELCYLGDLLNNGHQPKLMGQTLQEEKDTDDLLTQVAEREVNPAAMGKQAANDPSGLSRGAA